MISGSHDWLSVQAARLFSMACEARENGESELADLLTDCGRQCLDWLAKHEVVEANLSGPSGRVHQAAYSLASCPQADVVVTVRRKAWPVEEHQRAWLDAADLVEKQNL